jgi:hypothetical protein
VAENTKPAANETEEVPEVEAHSAEILGLQGVKIADGMPADGVVSPGSCSSCVGSLCM